MRWLFAGLSFAAFVAIALATATIRAENALRRHQVELRYVEVRDRLVELRRLETDLLGSHSSRRLADAHWHQVDTELARRRGQLE